jgi:hypothetical protein
MAGGGGPTMANAAQMPQVDPMQQLMHQGAQAGAIPLQAYLASLQQDTSPIITKPGDIARDRRNPSKVVWQNPAEEKAESVPEIAKLIRERDKLPPGHPMRAIYDQAIQKATTHQPGTNVTVGLQAPVSAMDSSGNEVLVQPTNRPGSPSQILTDPRTGKPFAPKRDANTPNKVADAQDVLSLADQADKLIGKATGSGIGAARDVALGVVGQSTEAGNAAAQLKVLGGALISKMPKMSGPQSDKDVQLYRDMAGRIGDPMVPAEQKKSALSTIRKINEKYAGDAAGWSIKAK